MIRPITIERFARCLCAVAMLSALPVCAMAWGTTGHREINLVAMRALPPELPAFLITPQAETTIEALGPEEDRLKGAGYSWDHDSDPRHYVDIGDDGLIEKTVSLAKLPRDMEAYGEALAAVHSDPYRTGYLPYSIADGWEQVRKDFAYWRAFDYLTQHAASAQFKAQFAAERARREMLAIHDIGVWAHFVGDGSQPLHTSIHFNDGGVHARFEGEFVRAHVTVGAVAQLVESGGPRDIGHRIGQEELLAQIGTYLIATNSQVPQLYSIEKRGGFRKATPEAIVFTTARVADGARELRDLVVQAWDNSAYESVGYPEIPVNAILNGRVTPGPAAFGND